jgi:manganese efflux pump family protein
MTFFEIFLIAAGLSMDCFAVSVSFGATRRYVLKDLARMAFFFGLFQGLMTFAGWWVGDSLKQFIQAVDHWVAFSILSLIGLRMILESLKKEKEKRPVDFLKFRILISLAIATSIDALMTGVSFGFIRVNILESVLLISSVTFLVTMIGGKLGEKTTFIPAKRAEMIGGTVLIIIGIKILFEHLNIF